MLFMGKRGLTMMGLDDNNHDNNEEGDGSVMVYSAAPASVPTA